MGLNSYFWKSIMINKLHKLKKMQTEQKLMQKGQIVSKINRIDSEVLLTKTKMDTTSVQKFGAVSDFTILAIHKNTMKLHISKLENQKKAFNKELELLAEEIIELQKETEQFAYLVEEERNEAIRKMLLAEQEEASEYIQSKYITG